MTKKARTTYHNCLRFLFRRGPCVWINACQIAMMISFLLFIAGAFVIFFMARFQNQKLLAEDKQYEEVKNEISFEHCKHIPMEEKFNTELCHDRSRELAFAWRYYKNNSTDDDTCFDIFEQVDCHTYLIQNNSLQNYTRPQKFLMCQGLFNVSINDTKEENVVWGPQILDLTPYLNNILHSSELFVKCPICKLGHISYYSLKKQGGGNENKNECYQPIETTASGWPAIAEMCDKQVDLGGNYINCTA